MDQAAEEECDGWQRTDDLFRLAGMSCTGLSVQEDKKSEAMLNLEVTAVRKQVTDPQPWKSFDDVWRMLP